MKKTLTMVLALVLVFALGVGGTLAWLSATTTPVVNTFTVGDINIDLNEHEYVPSTKSLATDKELVKTNENYKFVPGDTLPKDPYVTVKAGSEACWLFVKIDETNNTVTGLNGKVVSYEIDTNVWTAVEGEANVWYKKLDTTAADTDYNVLLNQQVTVNADITKTMADNTLDSAKPVLTFTAYAIQSANLKNGDTTVTTAEAAWDMVKPN